MDSWFGLYHVVNISLEGIGSTEKNRDHMYLHRIRVSELKALRKMKTRKTLELNGIPIEVFKMYGRR